MSLVYDAAQVVACVKQEPKDWQMGDRKGTSHNAKLAVVSASGEVASITLKAKTADDLTKKVAQFTIGKPAKIPIKEIVPVFKTGDRKPSGYEFAA
jgi:hypothetical protein